MRATALYFIMGLTALLWSSQALAEPTAPCSDDAECAAGEVCIDGDCLVSCSSDADCDDGFACNTPSASGPIADPAPPAPCPEDDLECEESKPEPPPAGENAGVCIEAPTSCSSDADCGPGELCKGAPTRSSGSSGGGGEGAPPSMDEGEDKDSDEGGEAASGICVPAGNNGWESECEEDSDCPAGMICDEIGMSNTSTDMAECICENGREGCECGEGSSGSGSSSEVILGCVQKPCESDADCGGDLVCITETWEMCAPTVAATPPCDPDDAECDEDVEEFAPEEPECETQSESYCAPKYMAPCEMDADCGEGFSCVEEEMCACESTDVEDTAIEPAFGEEEGGDGEDASDGMPIDEDEGEEDEEEDSDCSCEFTGNMICEPDDLPCSTDAECTIEGWVCFQAPSKGACFFDEETGEEVCEEVSSEGQCLPADWHSGSSMGISGEVERNAAAAADPNPEDASDANTSAPASGGTGEAGSEDETQSDADPANESAEDEGGCQGAPSSQGGLMLLMLMAATALLRRRVMLGN